MAADTPKHLLVRYSDKLIPFSDTIRSHNEIIKEHGYVWMGKFGKTISNEILRRLKKQIEEKTPTYVFLAQKAGNQYVLSAAELDDFSVELSQKEQSKVPKYYREKRNDIKVWFRIKKFHDLESGILKKIIINSSSMPASVTLPASMAGFFLVRLEAGTSINDFKKK